MPVAGSEKVVSWLVEDWEQENSIFVKYRVHQKHILCVSGENWEFVLIILGAHWKHAGIKYGAWWKHGGIKYGARLKHIDAHYYKFW